MKILYRAADILLMFTSSNENRNIKLLIACKLGQNFVEKNLWQTGNDFLEIDTALIFNKLNIEQQQFFKY